MAINCSWVGMFSEIRCLPACGMWPLTGSAIATPASTAASNEDDFTEVPSEMHTTLSFLFHGQISH